MPVRSLTVLPALLLLALSAGSPLHAGEGRHKGKDRAGAHGAEAAGARGFRDAERREIESWFRAHPEARQELPPGLARKGKLPPGWHKKVARGARVPDDVWEQRLPLPREILVKLPAPPPGVVVVRIHDRVVRAVERTHEVLDVLGLPHP